MKKQVPRVWLPFVRRVTSDWELARENLQRSVGLQQKYYDRRHRDIHYKVGDLVLLSTRNLKMKGTQEITEEICGAVSGY